MSNYILSLAPFCIEEEVLGSWLGKMPVTFAVVYVATTFKGLSEITHGWNEVSTIQWVFLLLVIGISAILLAFITRIAKASLDNEPPKHAQINNSLADEMLPLVANNVTIRIDPLKHVCSFDPFQLDLESGGICEEYLSSSGKLMHQDSAYVTEILPCKQ